jgi:hypothetical protein
MARFTVGKAVVTTTPTVLVDAGLPVGLHRFQLEVLTNTGQRSKPAVATIQVQLSRRVVEPTPVILSPTDVLTRTRVPSPSVAPHTVPPEPPPPAAKTATLAAPRKVVRRTTRKTKKE